MIEFYCYFHKRNPKSLEDWTVVPHLETDAVFGLLDRAQEIDPIDAERRLGIPRDWKMFDLRTRLLFEDEQRKINPNHRHTTAKSRKGIKWTRDMQKKR